MLFYQAMFENKNSSKLLKKISLILVFMIFETNFELNNFYYLSEKRKMKIYSESNKNA